MIVHKCDRCRRDMVAWMTVKVYPSALNPAYNVGNLVRQSCELELCEDCFEAVIGQERKNEKGEKDAKEAKGFRGTLLALFADPDSPVWDVQMALGFRVVKIDEAELRKQMEAEADGDV